MDENDWPIQEVARMSGTTSRTLRHYDAIGLLAPTRIAPNGYRHYDTHALLRLQRILLLRELGLALPQIGAVLAEERSMAEALSEHLAQLRAEQRRLARMMAAVERTVTALEEGGPLMAEDMFDGFDHSQHREEVEERWGADAYASGDRWWRSMSDADRTAWKQDLTDLHRAWIAAAESGAPADGAEAQRLAHRHVEWLRSVPGTPASDPAQIAAYVRSLSEMYVADPRFAANYGGEAGAAFVREALGEYVRTRL